MDDDISDGNDKGDVVSWSYKVEMWMYGTAFVLGIIAVIYTLRRLMTRSSNQWDLAARLVKYKISLTVADLIILFIYAPTQLIWIFTYFWHGGNFYCRFYKFLSTFGFHLTGNMQALIAIDRLNVMTKINKLNKESNNSTWAVVAAWTLALVCSIPQLFVFYVVEAPDGGPQCVSHWTMNFEMYRVKIEEYDIYIQYEKGVSEMDPDYVYPNGTAINPMDPLDFALADIEASFEYYVNLEKIYNVVHLTTIVFLPYLIELVSYLLIILLLNAASTGQFMGFRAVIKRAILKLPCVKIFLRMKDGVRRHHETTRERVRLRDEKLMANGRLSDRIKFTQSRILVAKRPSKSQSSSPTGQPLHFDFSASGEVRLAGYSNGEIRSPDQSRTLSQQNVSVETESVEESSINEQQKKSDSVLQYKENSNPFWNMRNKTIDLFTTELKEDQRRVIEDAEKALIQTAPTHTPVNEVIPARRLSDPVTGGEKKVTRSAPWMKTVVKAKRNTKKKVFVMITINLICWLPYFAHALISSLKLNDEFATKIHFYSALVVFNAISNILL